MAQISRVSKNNTKVWTDNLGITRVKLHNTVIVTFSDNLITLNSGTWRTVTTKARINQVSNQYKLGYQVYSKTIKCYKNINGKKVLWYSEKCWYVKYKNKELEFFDGMEIMR